MRGPAVSYADIHKRLGDACTAIARLATWYGR
jgi:hypothetical protein